MYTMLNNQKKLYIVPGLNEKAGMKNYKGVRAWAKTGGWQIISVKINWGTNKTISDYAKEVKHQILCDESSVIFGFSILAESKGFEPLRAFTPYLVSSEARSTTQPTLHLFYSLQSCSMSPSPAQSSPNSS
jgi:hypothetical protein